VEEDFRVKLRMKTYRRKWDTSPANILFSFRAGTMETYENEVTNSTKDKFVPGLLPVNHLPDLNIYGVFGSIGLNLVGLKLVYLRR
jgi:hypothetical protein